VVADPATALRAAGAPATARPAIAPPFPADAGKAATLARTVLEPGILAEGEATDPGGKALPVLRETLAAVGAVDPGLARHFVRAVLPQANGQMTATLLFFLAAARGGDVSGWLGGRMTQALEDADSAELLPRLAGELAGRGRAAETADGWRPVTLPFYQEGQLSTLTVHLHQQGGGTAGEADSGRRFLIDVELSRLGPLQFDGLVKSRRLDLVLRSHTAFPAPMRDEMRALFRDAVDSVGLAGGLAFRPGGHDWVKIASAGPHVATTA
ncbi:MAG: hypothetical protein HKM95_11670, partial [Inquilinus sp.]|nr:hypothetical protein [Inquilinus sp.]